MGEGGGGTASPWMVFGVPKFQVTWNRLNRSDVITVLTWRYVGRVWTHPRWWWWWCWWGGLVVVVVKVVGGGGGDGGA